MRKMCGKWIEDRWIDLLAVDWSLWDAQNMSVAVMICAVKWTELWKYLKNNFYACGKLF